ncbi:Aminoacyl-tRNA synthetase, class 1a, anticodon-binding [Artemisia annua]|uniref:valine--tRNA ligase n=1 Tax=Artemisia annua TaxID=35608 RepID=A0A2U1N3I8_ARTAN|nr:Aminoacyl-tRNA synthetase, class 1a, anticodon-binding [Artemisia annua]
MSLISTYRCLLALVFYGDLGMPRCLICFCAGFCNNSRRRGSESEGTTRNWCQSSLKGCARVVLGSKFAILDTPRTCFGAVWTESLLGPFAAVDKKKPTDGMTDKVMVVCSFPLFAELTMNKNELKALKRMPRFEVRVAVIEALNFKGLYRGEKLNEMRLGCCSRSNDVIDPIKKPQWYVMCDDMSKEMQLLAYAHKLQRNQVAAD